MKITLHGGTLEHIRDALDAVVEGTDAARALRGMAIATLEDGAAEEKRTGITHLSARHPELYLVSKDRQDYARWDIRHGHWERLHYCDECGREEWSEHTEWECNCVVEPTRNDPEGWRE